MVLKTQNHTDFHLNCYVSLFIE